MRTSRRKFEKGAFYFMNENEKYAEVLKELGEVLKNKNETISLQNWQIANLKNRVEELEAKLQKKVESGKIEYRN